MWFRRDLRLSDNAALYYALKQCKRLFCVFVFDRTILDKLPQKADRRVEFIWHSIAELKQTLQNNGGDLLIAYDHATDIIPKIAQQLHVNAVFTNKDYEPGAKQRDESVRVNLAQQHIEFHGFKDHVIFEQDEILTQAGKPFSVFTPFKNAWLKKVSAFFLSAYPVDPYIGNLSPATNESNTWAALPSLTDMGFTETNLLIMGVKPGESGGLATFEDFCSRIDHYNTARDYPAIKGVSYLSVHMRFGTLSIRHAAGTAFELHKTTASQGAMSWLNELIWRDFYFHVLNFNPHVTERSFKPAYDQIQWETGAHSDVLFKAWCDGQTGYPLVDAAMRQLNTSGYMHNRLRMVAACFLIKDLGIDWRWGEAYFATHLNDFDLSANNGGWQWASSSGCDAQPYFRIFNPVSQSEKFDSEGKFIRRYCPELAKLSNKRIHAPWEAPPMELSMADVVLGKNYPRPVVQHDEARKKTLERYAVVKIA
jgi:deoxyribodipyrimidine photo-lyase